MPAAADQRNTFAVADGSRAGQRARISSLICRNALQAADRNWPFPRTRRQAGSRSQVRPSSGKDIDFQLTM
jgi:hypothetical protein